MSSQALEHFELFSKGLGRGKGSRLIQAGLLPNRCSSVPKALDSIHQQTPNHLLSSPFPLGAYIYPPISDLTSDSYLVQFEYSDDGCFHTPKLNLNPPLSLLSSSTFRSLFNPTSHRLHPERILWLPRQQAQPDVRTLLATNAGAQPSYHRLLSPS